MSTLFRRPNKSVSSIRAIEYTIPFLKSSIPFAFNGLNFFSSITCIVKKQGVVKVSIVNQDVYIVQGSKNIAEIFRNPYLTMTRAYGIALKHCFGMKQRAVNTYRYDTSGSRVKPIPGSNVLNSARIGLPTHENLSHGLLGAGLDQITLRFEKEFYDSMELPEVGGDWTYYPDFARFIEAQLGICVLKTLFGPLLVQQPKFVDDLFDFDRHVMDLARRLPFILAPKAHRARRRVLNGIKNWHRDAHALSEETSEDPRHDGSDIAWGTAMVKDRQKMLLDVDGQDEDAVISADLALIWASVTNVVPSSVTVALHLFTDPSLLAETRQCVERIDPGRQRPDIRALEKQPLLQSLHAESLRFGVQIHIPRAAPHHTVSISNARIPKDELILVSTYLAHNDPDIWNTQEGKHPLDTFWAGRFLIDPHDPFSGPRRRPTQSVPEATRLNSEVEFSVEGLEGAWIPYGGGHHACPGRLLAKRIMILFIAVMVERFDIEPMAEFKYSSPRFGFGVQKPLGKIPFRIKRRR
ncbi:cytochrome P450 [Zopfia rhizophila CBS 207.26]|uniref:Cytochrome P450 n=1 Tax=Zopfia rhizophila CBS 207.26 TaxID=1314779 RepID=A0A6A6ET63_9PEZI|nr:cytochrome P450 [Zopfia rhizophila CBS 207.26]